MLQKILLLCFLAYLLSSCKEGPKVMVCISDPAVGGFDCYDPTTKKNTFLKYQDSDKYVAMAPDDAQTLFNYCAQSERSK
jgi:hypothetical protein